MYPPISERRRIHRKRKLDMYPPISERRRIHRKRRAICIRPSVRRRIHRKRKSDMYPPISERRRIHRKRTADLKTERDQDTSAADRQKEKCLIEEQALNKLMKIRRSRVRAHMNILMFTISTLVQDLTSPHEYIDIHHINLGTKSRLCSSSSLFSVVYDC